MKGLVRDNLDLLILSVVGEGATHGYAIVENLRERSGGVFNLPEGSIYPALYRLERGGLLDSSWVQVAGRRRRRYRLTRKGRAARSEKANQWQAFQSAVNSIVGRKPWPAKG